MKLRNPGPVEAAPILEGTAGELAKIIASWPGVAAYTHWQLGSPGVVDGAEFHLGDPELGHIHLDGTVRIPLDSALTSMLVRKGLGRSPRWSGAWITVPVRSAAEMQHAAWLFQLGYDRITGTVDGDLVQSIADASDRTRAAAQPSSV